MWSYISTKICFWKKTKQQDSVYRNPSSNLIEEQKKQDSGPQDFCTPINNWEQNLSTKISLVDINLTSVKEKIDVSSDKIKSIEKRLDSWGAYFDENLPKTSNMADIIKSSLDPYYAPGKVDDIYKQLASQEVTSIQSENVKFSDGIIVSEVPNEQQGKAVLIPNLVPFSIHLVNYLKEMNKKLAYITGLETKNHEYEKKYNSVINDIEEIKKRVELLINLNAALGDKAKIEKEKASLEEQLKLAQKSINELNSQKNISCTTNSELNAKNEKLNTELKAIKEENDGLHELKRIIPNYENDRSFFCSMFGDDWKQDIFFSFLLLQSEAKNKSDNIRTTFSRLDDAIYGTYSKDSEKLKNIRLMTQEKLNKEILAGQYRIQWPLADDEFNEKIHSPETLSGNRIRIAKTAIVKDANGTLITKSKVITEN